MILILVVALLVVVSIVMSYLSIKKDMKKLKHVEEVQKSLSKGKVIFYSPSSKSS